MFNILTRANYNGVKLLSRTKKTYCALQASYDKAIAEKNPKTPNEHTYIINTLKDKHNETVKFTIAIGFASSLVITPPLCYFNGPLGLVSGSIPLIISIFKAVGMVINSHMFFKDKI